MQSNFARFFKVFRDVPMVVGVAAGGIVLIAILTRYPGLISLEWRLDGGHVTIDGRLPAGDSK